MVLFVLSGDRQPLLHLLSVAMLALGVAGAIEHFLRNVWPTPYKLEKDSGHLLRVHRLTKVVEILTPTGWRRITDSDSDFQRPRMS